MNCCAMFCPACRNCMAEPKNAALLFDPCAMGLFSLSCRGHELLDSAYAPRGCQCICMHNYTRAHHRQGPATRDVSPAGRRPFAMSLTLIIVIACLYVP